MRLPSGSQFLCLAVLPVSLQAQVLGQVTIQSLTVHDQRIAPSTWFDCRVSNTGAPVRAVISGWIRSHSGVDLMQFGSEAFDLTQGVTPVNAGGLVYRSYIYGQNEEGQALSLRHRLMGGAYEVCIRIEPFQSGEFEDEYCDIVTVEDLLFMDPVSPYDGDTVSDPRPALHWTITGQRIPEGQTARLVLVHSANGDPASKSLATETPVYVVHDALPQVAPHPGSVKDLEAGKCYAWQVERSAGGLVIDRTEPWRFCVRKYIAPVPNKYVVIGKGSNAVYESTDGWIYFRFDEPYAITLENMTVLDDRGEPIKVEPVREGSGLSPPRAAGINLYEFDLLPYHLKSGIYTLRIIDGKGRKHHLKFHTN